MWNWRTFVVAVAYCLLALSLFTQAQVSLDPVQLDPQHFKMEYEDARIRVLRFRLPPGQKSPMHDHAARSIVTLTGARVRLTSDDGGTQDVVSVAGAVLHEDATRHAVENIGTEVFETVSTEFKDQRYIAKAPSRPKPGASTTSVAASKTAPKPLSSAEAVSPTAPTIAIPAAPEPRQSDASRSAQAQEPSPNQARQSFPNSSTPPLSAHAEQSPSVVPVPALQRETPEGVVKTATVNGAELACVERGQGSTVIFLHDTLGDYRSWSKLLEAVSPHFRVISFSRRYHYPNYSSGKEHDYTFQQNAKDLADFIRQLNAGAVHLVGSGYGASLAAIVAAKNPELARSVTIVDPQFVDLLPPARAELARATREEIYRIIRKPMNKGQTDTALQTYVDWAQGSGAWEHLTAEERSRYKQNANALKAQTYDAPSPAFSCAEAHNIKAAVLLIGAEFAPPNARDISTALSSCAANAQQIQVQNKDYVGYGVDANALMEFWAKHP